MWNVDIQSNIIDNKKCKATSLVAISAMSGKLTRLEGTWLELQVLIHALKEKIWKAMLIKYLLPIFSHAFTQVPPPFRAITTSSSNMLHASSMNNHF